MPRPMARRDGLRIALGGVAENFDGGLERAVDKELAGPVEEVAFAGVHVRGDFEFVGGDDEVAVFFFDFGRAGCGVRRCFFVAAASWINCARRSGVR